MLPAIVGSAIRAVYSGAWTYDSIDAAELAFSLALIGVIVLSSVSRLADKALRDALSPLFIIILALALCLFAGSVLMKLVHEGEQVDLIRELKAATAGAPALLRHLGADDRCTRILHQIRASTLFLSAFSVLLTLAARVRYSLDD
jgi:hypothetical protein